MQVGDFIEDRYRNESGEIVMVLSGFVVETSDRDNTVTYYCLKSSSDGNRYDMTGKVVTRNTRTCQVICPATPSGSKVE